MGDSYVSNSRARTISGILYVSFHRVCAGLHVWRRWASCRRYVVRLFLLDSQLAQEFTIPLEFSPKLGSELFWPLVVDRVLGAGCKRHE